jgi:pilus assembly protein Flp/PilA
MRRFLRKLLHGQSGQGMSEYLIIVALVAVAAIGVTSVFGKDIRFLFAATTDSLSGGQGTNDAVKASVSDKHMKDFGQYSDKGDK